MTTDTPGGSIDGAAADDGDLLRHSRVMAIGTIASRATGFLRTAVIAAAIGPALLGDAYNIANTTPNILYELLLGGVLTSVVVPLLVQAARHDSDGGDAYASRLLSVVAVVLAIAAAVAAFFGPQLVNLYGNWVTSDERHLAGLFSRYFLPQIFFYGVGATIGAILNARGRFAAPMWTPVLNNLVVIVTGLWFLAITHGRPAPGELGHGRELLLGLGTTAGIVVQTLALLPALRASGFRWKFRFDLRGSGLGHAARIAGWVLVYVAANQAAYLVIVRLASAAARTGDQVTASGFSPYQYAFMLFSLPHAIVTVSVVTALLPRMSHHADDNRADLIETEVSRGLRLSAALLIPASAALVALGPFVGVAVFGYGNTTIEDARFIGYVLAAFAVGLVPFSFFQLQLRAFYALQDTRTPALLNIWVNVVNVAVDVVLYVVLPDKWRVVGLALGYAASYSIGLGLMTRALRRRIGGVDGPAVTRTVVRLLAAAVPAAAVAAGIAIGVRAGAGGGRIGADLGLGVGLAAAIAVFLPLASRMRIAELNAVLGRLGR
ncbi:MAG: putative peptidoglycan lipid flippase [Frankiales bacterium]|nr:putative peptidoglycan lipid flippase [Frankiales bacterium]